MTDDIDNQPAAAARRGKKPRKKPQTLFLREVEAGGTEAADVVGGGEAGMTQIYICPECGEDLIATTLCDIPIWWCRECAYTYVLHNESQEWRDAYDRGYQR